MDSRAKLLGHPVHQMLVVFPLGLLVTSVIFDLIAMGTRNGGWSAIALYLIGAGIIGGLAAAIFGLIDWLTIPGGTRAKSIGLWHGVTNVVVVVLFIISWVLRWNTPRTPGLWALILSFVGIGLALIAGWLGGELVDRLGVGVDHGAHLNAPSSLSGRPASEQSRWTAGS